MSTPRKFGTLLLAFVLFGTPLLNCVMPTQELTAAEQECCKKMAAECGRAGMAQSHSCCHSEGSGNTRPLLKSGCAGMVHHKFIVSHAISYFELPSSQTVILVSQPAQLHGPPGETPPGITVLRI